jgi:hypothetical protein
VEIAGYSPIETNVVEACKRLLFAENAKRGFDFRELSRTGKISLMEIEVCLKTAKALRPTLA